MRCTPMRCRHEIYDRNIHTYDEIDTHEMHASKVHAHEMPMRYTPMRCTPLRCTPVRDTPMRCTAMRCTPMRYTLWSRLEGHLLGVKFQYLGKGPSVISLVPAWKATY